MRKITIEDLAGQEYQIKIDFEALEKSNNIKDRRLWTYLISYPYIIDFFKKADSINPSELILGNALVYSLMPTTMNIRKDCIEELLEPLTKLKNENIRLTNNEFLLLKNLVNNSVTGTSKLLHFVNPFVYPIWDSRVDRFITGSTKNTNSISMYKEYIENFDKLNQDQRFKLITTSFSQKLDYDVTNARAFEMIMYLSDLYELEQKSADPKIIYSKKLKSQEKLIRQIPKYKRDIFTFISNLNEVTADPLNPSTLKRDGYLLSEHYTNSDSIERARWVKSRRNLLISDNGNWTRMSKIASNFNQEGENILNKAKEEQEEKGKISEEILDMRTDLMNKIIIVCEQESIKLDIRGIIETQLKIKPNYMIGMEDFTIPVLMMCGMLDETFNPNASEINIYQKKTAEVYKKQYEGEFGFKEELEKISKFLVLHAYDYESALSGALATNNTKKDGVAISYGAPMKSKRWITKLQFGDKWEKFDEKLPEAYLIAQSMTLGAVNGYKDDTPVHILGVGSPILIALIGYLLRNSKAVSIDSTAPFKDAYAGTIYGSRHAFIKMKMYKVAAFALINNKPYESKTPFFKNFEEKYPSDWKTLRTKLEISANTNVKQLEDKLEKNQELVRKYIPFFTKMKSGDDPLLWDLRIARSGHNYWILKNICEDIRERKDDFQKLKEWTEYQIGRYKKNGSEKWVKAVEKCYELTEKYRK